MFTTLGPLTAAEGEPITENRVLDFLINEAGLSAADAITVSLRLVIAWTASRGFGDGHLEELSRVLITHLLDAGLTLEEVRELGSAMALAMVTRAPLTTPCHRFKGKEKRLCST
jgi:hypothetical protein